MLRLIHVALLLALIGCSLQSSAEIEAKLVIAVSHDDGCEALVEHAGHWHKITGNDALCSDYAIGEIVTVEIERDRCEALR